MWVTTEDIHDHSQVPLVDNFKPLKMWTNSIKRGKKYEKKKYNSYCIMSVLKIAGDDSVKRKAIPAGDGSR